MRIWVQNKKQSQKAYVIEIFYYINFIFYNFCLCTCTLLLLDFRQLCSASFSNLYVKTVNFLNQSHLNLKQHLPFSKIKHTTTLRHEYKYPSIHCFHKMRIPSIIFERPVWRCKHWLLAILRRCRTCSNWAGALGLDSFFWERFSWLFKWQQVLVTLRRKFNDRGPCRC